jgi:hypothetical protein
MLARSGKPKPKPKPKTKTKTKTKTKKHRGTEVGIHRGTDIQRLAMAF